MSGSRDKYMDRPANSAVIPTLQIYLLFIVSHIGLVKGSDSLTH